MLSQKPLLSNSRISPTIVPLRNSQEKAPVRSDGWLLVSPTGPVTRESPDGESRQACQQTTAKNERARAHGFAR